MRKMENQIQISKNVKDKIIQIQIYSNHPNIEKDINEKKIIKVLR